MTLKDLQQCLVLADKAADKMMRQVLMAQGTDDAVEVDKGAITFHQFKHAICVKDEEFLSQRRSIFAKKNNTATTPAAADKTTESESSDEEYEEQSLSD
jgi:hypothetical protein